MLLLQGVWGKGESRDLLLGTGKELVAVQGADLLSERFPPSNARLKVKPGNA